MYRLKTWLFMYMYMYIISGAHIFCTGNLGPTNYVCVAIKNRILIYEINRSKLRYEQKKVGRNHR